MVQGRGKIVEAGKTFLGLILFSGLRIRIIAEDNANAEDVVTYRCKHSSFKTILFIQGFFLGNDSLAYEKIRQKNPLQFWSFFFVFILFIAT